jgi:N-acetylmuramoyl-L-alanine amidase
VAVDIGHYPEEPGVISASGRPELDFNRELAAEVRRSLEARGFEVRMIETDPLLHKRTRQARGAALFVSIHHDSVKRRYLSDAQRFAGFSLFVSRFNRQPQKSLACASAIGAELRAAGFTASRYHADPVFGENRPFADEANGVHFYDNLAVGRSAAMPSVLIEAGVIVNRDEESRLKDPAVQRRLAEAIARGAKECLQ